MQVGELEVGLDPAGIDPEDLAAERDGVVVEALLTVQVGGPLVGLDGGAQARWP